MFRLESLAARHEAAFIASARASRDLHHPWIAPPCSTASFRVHLKRYGQPSQASHVAVDTANGGLIGAVHLNEIVYGALESAYLAYFVFRPYAGRGFMSRVLAGVIELAFTQYRLHRLEANVQPGNQPSKRLVQSLGFRLEGFSPRYLRINGAWRDHERYALTTEDWFGPVERR
tara:strand:+ start:4489 stop:5010 length:522 start_codon:yes stop_codon:yes gene_type:complete